MSGRNFNAPLVAAALLTCSLTGLLAAHHAAWLTVPGLQAAELLALDARLRWRGPRPPKDDQIVIVGFDDKLRRRYPEVFQRRAGWAKFIASLASYKAKVVAIDAFFASPETVLTVDVIEQVRRARDGLTPKDRATPRVQRAWEALSAVMEQTRGDELLANSIRAAGNVLLSVLFFVDEGEEPLPAGSPEPPGLRGAQVEEGVVLANPPTLRPPQAAADVYASLPQIATVTMGAGSVNVVNDPDGKVRRVHGVVEHGGRFYTSLGLSVARKAIEFGEVTYVSGEPFISLSDRKLPSDRRAVVLLNPLGGFKAFPHVSAADIIDGKVDAKKLAGKLVFVGYTDAARDRVATPLDDSVPGVELHATLAHNALHDELLQAPPPWHELIELLLLGLALTLAQLRVVRQGRAWLAGAAAIGLIIAWTIVAQVALDAGTVLHVAGPLGGVLAIAIGTMTTALATEGREKARLRRAFGQYVSAPLVERIANNPEQVRLGGVRRELTVLFSDIRGFSRFSERMDPEDLSAFLNEYLTPMTRLVLQDGGMLDKYIGDAVMAVYGAPLELPQHAQAACRSALAMIGALQDLNADWARRDLPEIRIGIGLNSGMMSVGNMGSEMRFDYTVMGDTVNLSARLEALTKEYGAAILCGPRTVELAGDAFVFRELDYVRVKGRGGTVQIFELLGEKGTSGYTSAELDIYREALVAYRQRQWNTAMACFSRLASQRPDDAVVAIMLKRVEALRETPPPEDWDGVYAQRNK